MKKTTETFVESMQTAPRRQWGRHRPKYCYHYGGIAERERGIWLFIGLMLGAMLMLAAWSLAMPKEYDPCDVNRDGKVSATDLLIVQRHILGLEATP